MPFSPVIAGDLGAVYDVLWGVCVTSNSAPARASAQPIPGISVLEGHDALTRAAPHWHALEQVGGAGTAFQTLAVAEAVIAAHLQRGELPRIVVLHEQGRPQVLFPTVLTRRGGLRLLRLLGDPLIQYGDAVAAPDARPEQLSAALAAACDPRVADMVWLRRVRSDARIAPALQSNFLRFAPEQAPFVDLARAAKPSSRMLRELRRVRRRLQELGELRFDILHGEAVGPLVDDMLAIKRDWLDQRGYASSVIGVPAWEAAIRRLAAGDRQSLLAAARLRVGGRLAAVELGLVQGDRWYAFMGAFAPEFAKGSPGQVQMADTMAACAADGIRTYDLLPPCDAYKARLASGSAAVHDYALALTLAGRVGLLALRGRPWLKRLVDRLPAPTRRRLFSRRS